MLSNLLSTNPKPTQIFPVRWMPGSLRLWGMLSALLCFSIPANAAAFPAQQISDEWKWDSDRAAPDRIKILPDGPGERPGFRVEGTIDEPLPFEIGPRGQVRFWLKADRDYHTRGQQKREKMELLSLGEVMTISFWQQGNAINLFVEWDESVDTAIDRHIRVLMPEFPGNEWHHFAVHWDEETGLINAFLDGTPFYWTTQRVSSWNNPRSSEVTLHPSRFALADVVVSPEPFDPGDLVEIVGENQLGALNHLIGGEELGRLDSEQYKGKLLYEADFSGPESVDGWVLEGPGVVDFEDGWKIMRSTKPDGPNGHVVHWAPVDFPKNFVAEWDFQLLSEDGLCIVFMAAKGRGGEDLFDPSLQAREGIFGRYVKGDIDNYHISYYADTPLNPRRTTNLRKNHGLNLVASGPVGVPPNSDQIHRITLVRTGSRIQLAVDGEKIIDYTDDGVSHGPVLGEGKIGLRQMQWTRGRYRDFKVYGIKDGFGKSISPVGARGR